MKKVLLKLFSVLFGFSLVWGCIMVMPLTAHAEPTKVSLAEAMTWLKGLEGTPVSNPLGGYKGECASLATAYYQKLTGRIIYADSGGTGHGYQFSDYNHSEGLGWKKYRQGESTPQAGDIIVQDRGVGGASPNYGHVSICIGNNEIMQQMNSVKNGQVHKARIPDKYSWIVRPAFYSTVTFNANGGSVNPTSKQVDTGAAIGTLPTPTRDGYKFNGWFTAISGGSQIYASTIITSDVTYYARWTLNTPNENLKTDNTRITNFTLGEYTFKSALAGDWMLDTNGGGNQTKVHLWQSIAGHSNQKIKIESAGNGYYYLRASSGRYLEAAGGGSADGTNIVCSNFSGNASMQWSIYRTSDGKYIFENRNSGKVLSVSITTIKNGNLLILNSYLISSYQRWILAPSTCTVTFNANGGSVSPVSKTINSGAAIGTLPTPYRSGYSFSGWFTAVSGGSQISASTIITSNVTYYARWAASTCTVTFNANGGTVSPASRTVNYGTSIGALPIPSRSGYSFNGWFTAVSGGSQRSASTIITSNVTYYARWTYIIPQKTRITNFAAGEYTIKSALGNFMLDTNGGGFQTKVHIWQTVTGHKNQKIRIDSVGNGYYYLKAVSSGRYLDAEWGGISNGTKVFCYHFNGNASMQWAIYTTSDGMYVFENRNSGRVLDVPNGSVYNGNQVQLYDYNGTFSQKWVVTKLN